jgi:hypothetical protein
MLRDFLDFLGIVGSIALLIGFIWLRIKIGEWLGLYKGLDRKSSIQTLFGDENK